MNGREDRVGLMGEPVLLASSSPRRRELLERAGAEVIVAAPAIDDAAAPFGHGDARRLVLSLAWFKAAQVLTDPAAMTARSRARWLIAADTVCALGGRILGKPTSGEEARRMIEALGGRGHRVLTGVALVELTTGARRLFVDEAKVSVGTIPTRLLETHLSQERWRGRAGGYNFDEVRMAGWPIDCEGDETTVTGLPMRLLLPMLREASSPSKPGEATVS